MAQMIGRDEIESLKNELVDIGRSLTSSLHRRTSSIRGSLRSVSKKDDDLDVEYALQWAELERLPTVQRLRSSLFDPDLAGQTAANDHRGKQIVDVTTLDAIERRGFIEKLIKHIENDNLKLLKKIKRRIDKVGVELPKIDVRYKDLLIEAECEVVYGKPLPTLWNSLTNTLNLGMVSGSKSKKAKIRIINEVSGIIKPGRMTLLLGPPGCGKTTFLKALSGNLSHSLKVSGEISYNGCKLEEFIPQKTSAYISQDDTHIPEMTVRETLDFSARCQGIEAVQTL
jgi:ABC-type multidrug transport system fused ATPase/permease subunit